MDKLDLLGVIQLFSLKEIRREFGKDIKGDDKNDIEKHSVAAVSPASPPSVPVQI